MSDAYVVPTPPPAPRGPDPTYSIPTALAFGRAKTWANLGQILLGGVLIAGTEAAGTIAQQICGNRIQDSVNRGDGTPGGLLLLEIAIGIALAVFGAVYSVGIVRAALEAIDGEPVRVSKLLRWKSVWPVFLAQLLTVIGTAFGALFLIIPGLVFFFLAYYAQYFIIDRGEGPWTAIISSIRMVRENLGTFFLFFLACIGVILLGVVALLIGLVIAIPVVAFATAYTYRAFAPARPQDTAWV